MCDFRVPDGDVHYSPQYCSKNDSVYYTGCDNPNTNNVWHWIQQRRKVDNCKYIQAIQKGLRLLIILSDVPVEDYKDDCV